MTERPYWIDDPRIDRNAHCLHMNVDEVASALHGFTVYNAACACGEQLRGPYDEHATFEQFDHHMSQVQNALDFADVLPGSDRTAMTAIVNGYCPRDCGHSWDCHTTDLGCILCDCTSGRISEQAAP